MVKIKEQFYIFIALFVLILDQLAKLIIKNNLKLNESFPIIKNFLNITYVTNTGSAFGILKGANVYLIFFSLIVLGVIVYYWDKIERNEKVFFSLIAGGIIGNLIDRVAYGYVIDFIAFSFWPAFNVADSALSIGIIMLILYDWRKKH